ncbi:AAA family ATPase [Lujinxingia vulgaris]|uniref:AAA family ATPase n=1 Tax=Lujinxingia vulgaris TaxID=2600176 RepID=A0A5C6X6U7_9DELT|nr:AAA family ATPase [Lujinxingia vulgaris]TXD33735.1 AAA family ATPase [Lujinxingia vulgaris]
MTDASVELAGRLLDKIEACEDEERYRDYRDQLYALGTPILGILRENLGHRHHLRRMAAATNLGRLGDRESIPKLIGLIHDPHAGVREMALFSLGILGDSSSTEAVLGAMHDYDADVRYRALVALGDLNYAHLEEVLIRAMEDESYGVREQALTQLRTVGTPRCLPVVLKALLERELEMQQSAEEILDRLVPRLTREQYKKLPDQLTPRERRLVLNYLEARNLQEVYGTLWQRLQLVSKASTPSRGLDKYGRLLHSEDERSYLMRAFEREDVVSTLVEHFTDDRSQRSMLLVGEAGVGKTAIIHEVALRLSTDEEGWQILETNTSELISGTRYLGDWETKLKEMAEAILKHDKVLMYITNPNDLLGAGAHSKSDENFADFFKPYLQRGQLRIIAECTEDDLKNGLSRDPGFLRLFRQVKVQPMDEAETLAVLKRRLSALNLDEDRLLHAEPGCLEQVRDFAESFYTRSFAPGRACDLMDALIDYTLRQEEPSTGEFVLRSHNIPPCLAEVTGMSLDLLDDTLPMDLEETRAWFKRRLIDQERAVDAIVDRLAMVKTGMHDPARPLGVFFLVGPTGVGKTYFTGLVAERLFGSKSRMVRFDLSEYQGRFALEKLIGSPHDKDREGLLTEAIRNQPFSVLLFDEFEKADAEIFNLFLQILDEGRLTDARGRTTDFRQTLIFLTSNLGASRTSVQAMGFGTEDRRQEQGAHIRNKLDEFFAPEFLNRLDEVLVFNPLSPDAMERLVELELNKALERRGFKRRRLQVEVDPAARQWLEARGFSERFGARELKRTLEKHVLTAISRALLENPGPHAGKSARVGVVDDQIRVTLHKATTPPAKSPGLPREPRAPSRVETP